VWWPTKVDLSLRTRELYEGLLKNWIYAELPRPPRRPLALGNMPVTQITEYETEQWHLSCRARKHADTRGKACVLQQGILIHTIQSIHRPTTTTTTEEQLAG